MAEQILRGHVWLIDLGDPIGYEAAWRRPALVVSDDPANRHGLAVVCPIGPARRDYPTRVEVEPGLTGVDEVSYVQCEQVRTVSSQRCVHRLGQVGPVTMHEVERVLRLLLRL